ncbi:hypothetical protein DVH07_05055 [Hafnia paralvei]|nr:hypothetical protein DU449_05055 [Hafnia paralvei]RDA70805.1 hypothetical protein DVH09_05440 [Hafnia paralvei]RDA73756.1 hypothetical protein DVH08_00580 [Hafnia paralvei]RDA80240.1 hypothetical protein DVH10_04905 [Hafnia paralvei]RDA80588.1 hypothetical protein DVH07_05055 [Hafnia paralvei]
MHNPLSWIDPLGLVGEECCPGISSGADVTEDMIKKALEGDPMQTLQGDVSLPAIQRYVDRLLKGDIAPPIKVDGNVIVDGNHRYISGKVLGVTPETTPGTLPLSKSADVKPISSIGVSDIDWGNR